MCASINLSSAHRAYLYIHHLRKESETANQPWTSKQGVAMAWYLVSLVCFHRKFHISQVAEGWFSTFILFPRLVTNTAMTGRLCSNTLQKWQPNETNTAFFWQARNISNISLYFIRRKLLFSHLCYITAAKIADIKNRVGVNHNNTIVYLSIVFSLFIYVIDSL